MKLFLGLEAQTPAAELISIIIDDVNESILFVTSKNCNLEETANYGTEFMTICVIPTCICMEWLEDLGWKERKLIKRKAKEADIRLHIDYEDFSKATPEMQRLIYIKTLIDSIEVIQQKSKGDFNGEKLIADILVALDVKKDDLDEVSR